MRASDLRAAGLTAMLALAAGMPAANAQTPDIETRLREALRTTTTQLREAQDEVAALQAKQTDYEQQIQALTAKLAVQPPPAPAKTVDTQAEDRLRTELEQSNGKARQAEEQLAQSQTVLEKWQAAYKQAADVARARDADAKKYEAAATQLAPRVAACEEKNTALYKLGLEVLAKFEDKDVFDELKEDEPFTQIARVKLENLVQDYEDKFHDQKIVPAPGAQQSAR